MHSTPKKEKHHANSRVRRRSDAEKKSKKEKDDKEKDKDTDAESVVSTASTAPSTAHPALHTSKCPLRFLISGMIEAGDEKQKGCPLRRVQLWHTIPLCLLAIINLLLIIVALLGLAGYKIMMGIHRVVVEIMRSDLEVEPYVEGESVADTDGGDIGRELGVRGTEAPDLDDITLR
ncbi:hypothetical protein NHQ30_006578 [Ciborinia camelliae]|nr:hypothetical protein NHQ30_006578 [Ciborinia camelliae]